MVNYWPIFLIVFSNVFYHICSKSSPEKLNPLAALTITYLIGTVCSALVFFITNPGASLIEEYHKLNWAPFVLGVAIVGLEAGYMYLYKSGWNINSGYLIVSIILSITLLFVGLILYNEPITPRKILGVIVCILGIIIMRK
ncbi:EamA family transporter [Peptoniphilus catoniae]|uniref:EamA family transporter n=1 Tax=Peptoniphilus catoniae TaxID=1660341 RepID=UPI0010FD08F8|nr:EamA family transporter [Peptoniphilus catoniae]